MFILLFGVTMRSALLSWAEARILAYIKSAEFTAEEVAVIDNLKKRIDTELDILRAKVAGTPAAAK